jgi:chromosome segregation ATPase
VKLRRRPEPERRHHLDPEIERQLEHIRSLKRRARSKEQAIEDDRAEIRALHEAMRKANQTAVDYPAAAVTVKEAAERQVRQEATLREGILLAEQEIDQIHDEIAKRQAELGPSDLAYL